MRLELSIIPERIGDETPQQWQSAWMWNGNCIRRSDWHATPLLCFEDALTWAKTDGPSVLSYLVRGRRDDI